MLSNQDIIYFSNDWSADNRTSSHHIAQQLSKSNRLLYVEASGLRAPSACTRDLKRVGRKIVEFLKGPRAVAKNVHVFTPLILPFHKYAIIRRVNKLLLVLSLQAVSRKLGFKNPVLWIVIPHMSVVIGHMQEKLVVYYCVDDFSSLPGVESQSIARFDAELTRRADIVFTPSEPLYAKKSAVNKHTFLSPHGVDIKHFSKVFNYNLSVPDDMKSIQGPVIGFFGLIEKWVDLDLIKFIAVQRPSWSIVLIGRAVQDISMFDNVPNVHFLGSRSFEALPSYAKLFDVTIIPYVLNNQVKHANPIKLREYLAMGKPVVTVRNPEIEKFSDVVYIADSPEDFVKNIETALGKNSKEQMEQRVQKVKDSSWDNRFKSISSITESFLFKEVSVDKVRDIYDQV